MDTYWTSEPVFIVDLNQLEGDDLLPVRMDFTLNLGANNWSSSLRRPELGSTVKIHSDDDDELYYAKVVKIVSDRKLIVRVNWDSCEPVLTPDWSSRIPGLTPYTSHQTLAVAG